MCTEGSSRPVSVAGAEPEQDQFKALLQGAAGVPIQHLGVPVSLEGHAIGSVCILHAPGQVTSDDRSAALAAAEGIARRIAQAMAMRKTEIKLK